jgi:Nucleotidyl transferase of unknown function (DUF2204)
MTSKRISVLAAFAAAGVEFAVVGGVAVIAHGYVRTTNDLDIFIRPSEENARAAYEALKTLGVALEGVEPLDLLDDEEHVRFGPNEDHVDVLASIGEMPFDRVWQNRVEMVVDGLTVPVISKADLIANKRQTGRHRDLADAEELELLPDVEFDLVSDKGRI